MAIHPLSARQIPSSSSISLNLQTRKSPHILPDPDITPPSTKDSHLDQERFRFGVRRASPLSICFPFSKFTGPTEKPIERAKGQRQRCRCAFFVGADQKTNRKRRCSPHSKSKTLLSSVFDLECGEHRRFRFAFFFPSFLGRPKSQSKGRRASGSAVDVLSLLGPTKNQIESGDARRTPNENAPLQRFRFGVRRASPLSICFLFSKFPGPTEKPIERAKGQRHRCRCAFFVGADQKPNRKRRCSPHSKSKTLFSKRKTLGAYLS